MGKKINLFPRINKANNQINFQLPKKCLPKEMKDKLPSLKSLEIDLEDFDFGND